MIENVDYFIYAILGFVGFIIAIALVQRIWERVVLNIKKIKHQSMEKHDKSIHDPTKGKTHD